jgi:uncharacterized protein (TIGR03032 family)
MNRRRERALHLHTFEPVVSDGFAAVLAENDVSVVAAAGSRLWLITTDDRVGVVVRELGLDGVTAAAWHGDRLFVASAWQVWTFVDAGPDPDGGAEHLLLPQEAQTTGGLGITDLAVGPQGPVFASGLFSCLATLHDRNAMRPIWVPPGLSALRPETRSLLTGVALVDGRAAFVTAAGLSDEPNGWESSVAGGGVVLTTGGEHLLTGLTVPRNPRWSGDRLVLADSGTGRVLRLDPATGQEEPVVTLAGVLGALDVRNDLAVVGYGDPSRAALAGLEGGRPGSGPVHDGLALIDLRSGTVAGTVELKGHAGSFAAVALLPDILSAAIAAPRGLTAQSTAVLGDAEPLARSIPASSV